MADDKLSAASYVVLGLTSLFGPTTPYGIQQWIDLGIGYFWRFPRARLYTEPARLARLGLLTESREPAGRRRLVYEVTDEGREVLRTWLRAPTPELPEIRDHGLLKLYLSGAAASPEDVVELARQQAEAHRARLAAYEEIAVKAPTAPELAAAVMTLELGLRWERMSLEFWTEIATGQDPRR
jgi:PadR family transcriptional regulator, regulatory protein AphA